MFRTIIVPLDGSAHAEAAVPYALAEARDHGAALVLVRVVARPEPCENTIGHGGPAPGPIVWPRAELVAAEGEAVRYLQDVRRRFGLGPGTTMVVMVGEPCRRLVAEIRRHPRPLVVMTTGDPAFSPTPHLSELAHRLLALGLAPVLAVRDATALTPCDSDVSLRVGDGEAVMDGKTVEGRDRSLIAGASGATRDCAAWPQVRADTGGRELVGGPAVFVEGGLA